MLIFFFLEAERVGKPTMEPPATWLEHLDALPKFLQLGYST